jgi:hypothetical protein
MRYGSCRSDTALPFRQLAITSLAGIHTNFSVHGWNFITVQIELNPRAGAHDKMHPLDCWGHY